MEHIELNNFSLCKKINRRKTRKTISVYFCLLRHFVNIHITRECLTTLIVDHLCKEAEFDLPDRQLCLITDEEFFGFFPSK